MFFPWRSAALPASADEVANRNSSTSGFNAELTGTNRDTAAEQGAQQTWRKT
jgi:hypothetical protein